MSKRLFVAFAAIVVFVAAALAGWWWVDLRWRPHTLSKHAAEIEALLNKAGWVGPGLSKDKVLWMISYRSCPDCIRFEDEEFPRLHNAGVDTRVIMAPRPKGTTPAERTGIAALWADRSWKTYETWTSMPVAAWTAEGLPSADTHPERAALVQKAHDFVQQIIPLLKDNGVDFRYPTLIWRDRQGRLRGCACEKRETYRFVRSELGVT